MNKLYISLSLFIFVACSPPNIPHEGLEEKEGLMYEIDSQVPYSGPYEFYSGRNGQLLESIGSYKEGLKDELWKFYHDNGQLKELGNYKKGNRNGPFEFYHDNGQLDTSGNFKDGIIEDGVWKFYYDNGQLKELGNYKNGNPNGPFEAYYDNGQLLNQGNFKDGKYHGTQTWFDHYGDLELKTEYTNDKKHGWEISYYSDGSMKNVYCYEVGNYIKESEFCNGVPNPINK